MWFEESVFYQIYPLGLCGAPRENDGGTEPRILKLLDWVPHIKKLGADAVYFCPVFESDAHGYDTRDYTKLAMTRAIILRWTRALAQTKILPLCAKQFTARA